ncbi:MAG TPA: hypothetical protein VGE10_00520 [Zeimonas sp.]
MKPYEERKARERMAVGGAIGGSSKGGADLHHPLSDAGRTAEKLAEKADARWSIVVALLFNPERESNRLAALLERMPTERRRHEIEDDCMRRPGAGRRSLAGATRSPGDSSCSIANPESLVRAREDSPGLRPLAGTARNPGALPSFANPVVLN